MERENNNIVVVVVITVLVMIILGFAAYFVYDKFLLNDNNEPDIEENTGLNQDVNNGSSNDQTGNTQNNNNESNVEENNSENNPSNDNEQSQENKPKVITFEERWIKDLEYIKLEKDGSLKVGIRPESDLYKKYSKEHVIAKNVKDVYDYSWGNAGYRQIFALKKDGTIDRMEIPVSYLDSDYSDGFVWEENYKGLKNITHLTTHMEGPNLIEQEDGFYYVYNEKILAIDVEENVHDVEFTHGQKWVKRDN